MRWAALLGCALWAMTVVGCAEDDGGPAPFRVRAGSSTSEPGNKQTTTTTTTAGETHEEAPVGTTSPAADVEAAPNADPKLIEHLVKPADADPAVKQALQEHYAYLDTRVAPKPELVLYLAGANVKPVKAAPMLKEIASYGFRVIGLRYMNDFVVQEICNANPNEVDCQGKLRREVIEGLDVSAHVDVPKEDSVDVRLAKALAHLDAANPGEGWGAYLTGDAPAWAKIVVVGHSSGASSAGRMSKLRALAGVMMLSGPNDNSDGVVAKWMSEPATTPVERIWAFSDTDDEQFVQHKRGWTAMGLLGPATSIDGKAAPFDDAHRFTTSRPGGGHNSTATGNGDYTAVWRAGLGL